MASLTIFWAAALLVAAPATSPPAPATGLSPASDVLAEASRIYDTASDPALANDTPGRLRIYERALAVLDTAPPDMLLTDRFRVSRLFYRTAIAVHRSLGPTAAQGTAELDALLPELRAAQKEYPDSANISGSLSQVLRFQTNIALREERYGEAAGLAREGVDRMRAIVAANNDDDFTVRSLAIDLDNLARIEARLGHGDKSSELGLEALGLFRKLAKRIPESRPAQGSLLISLVRRAVDQGEPHLLDEAASVGAEMERRGLLDDRYRPMIDDMDNIRADAEAMAAKRRARTD
jgi:hypothetical protein